MVEEWRGIDGFPMYQVSNIGRVRSLSRRARVLKTFLLKGYLAVPLRFDTRLPKGRNITIHRLVAIAFVGAPNGQVRHLDGNRFNNVWTNLRWGTAKDNATDRDQHGMTQRGESHYKAVLNENLVRHIRALKADGVGPSEIGRRVGMNKSRVHEVTSRLTWKHVL